MGLFWDPSYNSFCINFWQMASDRLPMLSKGPMAFFYGGTGIQVGVYTGIHRYTGGGVCCLTVQPSALQRAGEIMHPWTVGFAKWEKEGSTEHFNGGVSFSSIYSRNN